MDVTYSSWASEDFRSATRYYSEQSPTLARSFLSEVDAAVELISGSPHIGMEVGDGNRRIIVRRFPFVLIYRVESDRILILTVGHQRQHPDHWKSR
ncbi:MAG: type II toxin-antitoxin system RelE/ParE family toxin [Bacteroidetes bacterium]|nr:type II toxin-antitoxin system RelE/ParE family toxin [Bacteroidota bacterium]